MRFQPISGRFGWPHCGRGRPVQVFNDLEFVKEQFGYVFNPLQAVLGGHIVGVAEGVAKMIKI